MTTRWCAPGSSQYLAARADVYVLDISTSELNGIQTTE